MKKHSKIREQFEEVYALLKDKHPRSYKTKFEQFVKKGYTTRNNLRNRTSAAEKLFSLSLTELRNMIAESLYQRCYYCGQELNLSNICIDHMTPLTKGGDTTVDNLQVICKRCNTRKGPLTDKAYICFLDALDKSLGKEDRDYILQKLSMRGYTSYTRSQE